MSNTPETIDVLGIKVPATGFYPRPVVRTYYLKKPADMFYTPDKEATKLFILHQGAGLVYRQTRTGFITPIELLIGPTYFSEPPFRRFPVCYRNFAEPLQASTVTVVDWRLREQLYSYPGVRDRLEDESNARKERQEEMQVALVTKSVLARLATVLPMLARKKQVRGVQVLRVSLPHHKLAMAIGSSRESVSANLGKLQNRKLVSLNCGAVILLEPGLDQLRLLAAQEKF